MAIKFKIILLFIFWVNHVFAQKVGVFYDEKIPQFEFAASDIKKALNSHGFKVVLKPIDELTKSKLSCNVVMALKSDVNAVGLLAYKGVDTAKFSRLGEQAYALRTTNGNQLNYWAIGGDITGAMYGGLQLAENITFNALVGTYNEEDAPYLKKRGIKFNIAFDQNSSSFDSDGDQDKSNIKDVWDMSFWKSYLDDLARYRYNTLSFWTLHPFTSMIKLEEYPDVAIQDVTDGYGNLVKKMTIDEKIAFWQEVMEYADNRSIDIFYFTWNIFLGTAEGKYGITHKGSNEISKEYMRKSVKEFLLTYPHVDGIGVTAGERMRDLSFDEREKWLWDTYVMGILDAKKVQENRKIRFIHRHWNTAVSDIMSHFEEYPDAFEFSFKYARAHMYSSTNIEFEDFLLEEMPDGTKCWWNVRNDDIFQLRWGNPEYARNFLLGFHKDKTAGYLMGSDGYTWGRVYSDKDPTVKGKNEITKHWYNFLMWGRLGYNPDLPNDVFKNHLKLKFPEAPINDLYLAWKAASEIIPQTTRFSWKDWDGNWYPEGCKSGKFINVKGFMVGQTMQGSGIVNIEDYCQKKLNNETITEITPFDVANNLENYASEALSLTSGIKPNGNTELKLIINDITAFAHLGNYYSEKIRGATELALFMHTSKQKHQNNAVSHLKKALMHWKKYAERLDAEYTPKVLARTGKFDWNQLTKDVEHDIEMAKNFEKSQIDIVFEHVKDGAVYPVGTDLKVELSINSTLPVVLVGLVPNGEYIGVKKSPPYLWDSETTPSFKNMNTGIYELKVHATDIHGVRVEKIISITIK
ncbi:hypothetical protein [Labilibacter marinus]|uniref:hypothetical protein n=1 Tax=Labilibacter marinus TaxID=1477105 RepID=UPI000832FD2A|nr:hypothetical protein [Labilibacter marinus]